MARILPTLEKMIRDRIVPVEGGVWVDVYNRSSNSEIAGTIRARVSSSNMWYVTEVKDC